LIPAIQPVFRRHHKPECRDRLNKIVAGSGHDWLGAGMADAALPGEQRWLLYFMFSTG
jgi:hypothetical protein